MLTRTSIGKNSAHGRLLSKEQRVLANNLLGLYTYTQKGFTNVIFQRHVVYHTLREVLDTIMQLSPIIF